MKPWHDAQCEHVSVERRQREAEQHRTTKSLKLTFFFFLVTPVEHEDEGVQGQC